MSSLYEVALLIIIGFTGGLLGITPLLIKHSEVFAATVPPAEYHSPELTSMRGRYCVWTFVVTVLVIIVTVACLAILENAFFIVYIASTLVIIVVSFALYLNPDDPALFVPKRFGIGWTNNYACLMAL